MLTKEENIQNVAQYCNLLIISYFHDILNNLQESNYGFYY